jgi:hypothetical protein
LNATLAASRTIKWNPGRVWDHSHSKLSFLGMLKNKGDRKYDSCHCAQPARTVTEYAST